MNRDFALLLFALLMMGAIIAGPTAAEKLSIYDDGRSGTPDAKTFKQQIDSTSKVDGFQQSMRQRAAARTVHAGLVEVSTIGRPTLGRDDAPITIVEFSDYQCPFCARHAATAFSQLKTQYVDTGKVRYVFRDLPAAAIHAQARKAAEAAHCAGDQGMYWQMHDTLFANQMRLLPEDLKRHAAAIGLNEQTFGTVRA
jgi:protein-disulfide isomerase